MPLFDSSLSQDAAKARELCTWTTRFPRNISGKHFFLDHELGDLEATARFEDRQKLLFYALRRQAEHGPCTGAAPSIWWTRERTNYNAWKQLGDMSRFEAMVNF
ncbi:hypothetical protein TcCL_NonESM07753 [Trypanosoma cruzi]|nr:hypothetical protein TcCL_NonESM07753 [Trypanosoma cruzi]